MKSKLIFLSLATLLTTGIKADITDIKITEVISNLLEVMKAQNKTISDLRLAVSNLNDILVTNLKNAKDFDSFKKYVDDKSHLTTPLIQDIKDDIKDTVKKMSVVKINLLKNLVL